MGPASEFYGPCREVGRLLAERYAEGVTADTPLPGWSMTKSVMATLTGLLARELEILEVRYI